MHLLVSEFSRDEAAALDLIVLQGYMNRDILVVLAGLEHRNAVAGLR